MRERAVTILARDGQHTRIVTAETQRSEVFFLGNDDDERMGVLV